MIQGDGHLENEKHRTIRLLETLQQSRLSKKRLIPGEAEERGPAFLGLMVPPQSLEEDLNVDINKFVDAWNSEHDERAQNLYFYDGNCAQTFWNYDGLLLLWKRMQIQFLHTGAIEFVVELDVRANHIRDDFWGIAKSLIGRYCPVIEKISGGPDFYLLCGLVRTEGIKLDVSGLSFKLDQPFYSFPPIRVDGSANLRVQLEPVKLRVGHTLGSNWN